MLLENLQHLVERRQIGGGGDVGSQEDGMNQGKGIQRDVRDDSGKMNVDVEKIAGESLKFAPN